MSWLEDRLLSTSDVDHSEWSVGVRVKSMEGGPESERKTEEEDVS